MSRPFRRRLGFTAATQSGHRPHFALRLEALEDRTVPSPIPVTNLYDNGPGSLRQAIFDANSLPGDDNITFNVTGTVNMASLSTNIAMQGPGANRLTVHRNSGGSYRIFTVTAGATVTLYGLTISNGQAQAAAFRTPACSR